MRIDQLDPFPIVSFDVFLYRGQIFTVQSICLDSFFRIEVDKRYKHLIESSAVSLTNYFKQTIEIVVIYDIGIAWSVVILSSHRYGFNCTDGVAKAWDILNLVGLGMGVPISTFRWDTIAYSQFSLWKAVLCLEAFHHMSLKGGHWEDSHTNAKSLSCLLIDTPRILRIIWILVTGQKP